MTQKLFTTAGTHIAESGLNFGWNSIEIGANIFTTLAAVCHIKGHCYISKRAMPLNLTPIGHFPIRQVDVPSGAVFTVGRGWINRW